MLLNLNIAFKYLWIIFVGISKKKSFQNWTEANHSYWNLRRYLFDKSSPKTKRNSSKFEGYCWNILLCSIGFPLDILENMFSSLFTRKYLLDKFSVFLSLDTQIFIEICYTENVMKIFSWAKILLFELDFFLLFDVFFGKFLQNC